MLSPAADLVFSPLGSAHRDTVQRCFDRARHPLCEYSFGALFAWQAVYDTHWAIADQWLLLRYVVDGHARFVCPVGEDADVRPAVDACLELLRRRGEAPRIDYVPARVADRLRRDGYALFDDRDNADYVYAREDLAELPGRRHHRKRNHVAAFLRAGEHRFEPLTAENHRDALAFAERASVDLHAPEISALMRGLEHHEHLGLMGRLLRGHDGGAVGLALGEPLDPETFVVHFEIADRNYPGAYQALCQLYARAVPPRFRFVNREQDMGAPGLRRAKLSYHPLRLEPAYSIK
ncbi:MAG TPA: phosphatidylglycerol lysyltransferase domain-containing protein [Nannocystaceae bacterium]|nr:phosphatidylglycerol lysyltransferase domain-containing protein [Nannocystaceae bacterium]